MIASILGKLFASPLGWRVIHARSNRTPPHRHLHDLDGSLYMGRWRIIDEGTRAGRILERLTGYASVRLHLIMRADHDRELHNHPFRYRTFVLRGFYGERYANGLFAAEKHRILTPGDTATGSDTHFHRITAVSEGGVWTLFCMSRNQGEWGFNVGGKFMNSVRYLARKGYGRTQIEEAQTP
jgi:hypothetical protein